MNTPPTSRFGEAIALARKIIAKGPRENSMCPGCNDYIMPENLYEMAEALTALSETQARLSNDEVMAWVGRHDLSMNVYEARRVLEDARSIRPGDPITNGVPSSEDPPSLR